MGCYTLVEAYPFELLDWVVSMGSGIGIANGMAHVLGKNQKIVAYIGDSTFFHTGIQPLLNAIKNDLDFTILIFNNYWTAMTGHQEDLSTPREIIKRFGTNSQIDSRKIDLTKFLENLNIPKLIISEAYNIEKLEKLFHKALLEKGLKVILINQECALERKHRNKRQRDKLKSSKNVETYYTISKSCPKCNECIEYFGCPAINISNKKKSENLDGQEEEFYYIDETKCVPEICLGMCKTICKDNMIRKTIVYHKNEKKREEGSE
ncbi:MAG: thiamine pyrophosphate-dependent enzyme [Candidatus Lokiarchaeota archaeon]